MREVMGRFKLFFILFISLPCLFTHILKAQTKGIYEIGLPLVRNFAPKEYKGFSQNWSFVQDSRGVLYFANGDGVLEYDGVQWRVIKLTNDYTAFSLAIDNNNRIYVGSANEFGYLAPSRSGDLKYVSLLNKFELNDRKFNYIRSLFSTKNGIFFIAGEKLYRWDGTNLKYWKLKKPCNFYKYNDHIVVWQKSIGLKYLNKDSLEDIKSGSYFSNISLQNILPYGKKDLLLVSRDSGLYIMSDPFQLKKNVYPSIYKFYNQAFYFFKHNQLLSSMQLKNGNYAFSTLRGGTAIMDKEGNLMQILDKKAGIQNETHNDAGEDQQNAIWLSLDNGITRVDISSPVSFWNDDMGLKGSVLSVTRFKDKIYVGTWQGLFYHDFSLENYSQSDEELNTDISQFKLVKGILSTTWDQLVVKNARNPEKDKLLIATSGGVYVADNYYATQIAKGTAIKLYQYKKDSSKIFAGNDEGVMCFSAGYSGEDISITYDGLLNDLSEKITSIAEDDEGKLWISTEFEGVYCLEFTKWNGKKVSLDLNDKESYSMTHYDTLSGLPSTYSTIYQIRHKLYFLTEDGIYVPVKKKSTGTDQEVSFIKIVNPALDFYYRDVFINLMSEDCYGNLWLQFTDNAGGTKSFAKATMQKDSTYTLSLIPFKTIPQMEVYSIFPEKSGVAWFGGDDGLVRYDGSSEFKYNLNFNALIRKVIVERDSVLFAGTYYTDINDSGECSGLTLEQPDFMKPEISYSYNSIEFEYASTTYYSESSRRYKVYLEGFDKKWSDWSLESKKEYTNLPPGSYMFHVIAKNIFDTESKEAIYEFEILPPWYRTWIAYIAYLLIAVFMVRAVVRYSNKRLREAKLKLEELVKERTNEINSQKRELEIEKEKSDKLLLNILPFKIAEELKVHGNAKTKFFDSVTVMFSDFKDFTVIAQQLEPQDLIAELNRCFVFFDDVCVRHNIEKIKTVGDSFMCAGGVPIRNKSNPVDIVLAAFEMRDFISRLKKEQSEKGRTLWKIRIGVHTGEIISGVVGKKKFAYDIWGDTVNTASRMEQTSTPNKINISGVTYELVKEFFDCTYRGKIPVKNKGDIDMYFADRIKKELSVDDDGRIPNQKFWELYEKHSQEDNGL
jgi:class 3 adenylate cyclase/ligand-binding sensor domain-containing protein